MKPKLREVLGTIRGYEGTLSSYSEWHALIIGLGGGFVSYTTGDVIVAVTIILIALGFETSVKIQNRAVKEIRKESWYAIAGVLIGYLMPQIVQQVGV